MTSAIHNPSGTNAKRNKNGNQSNSAGTASGALYIGAFVGIPRSAADNGVVVTVNANKAADPTAKMRRMTHPSINKRHNSLRLTPGEASRLAFSSYNMQFAIGVAFGQQTPVTVAFSEAARPQRQAKLV
jgi:hypothetical protein